MDSSSSQKFITRNRAPRVHIEYEVETYGSRRKVELPFIMGVMGDLSGTSGKGRKDLAEREFLEIDMDNFDTRLKEIAPSVTCSGLPEEVLGKGRTSVTLNFSKMEDFSPAAVARQIAPLNALLEARTKLSDLLTYMDGKDGAEAAVTELLKNDALLKALAAPKPAGAPEAGPSSAA